MKKSYIFLTALLSLFLLSCKGYTDEQKSAFDEEVKTYLADSISEFKLSDSGLYYKILNQGEGDAIRSQDEFQFKMIGKTLHNDSVFISEVQSKTMKSMDLIDGIREGVSYLNHGGEISLVIPTYLGYGPQKIPGVNPGSHLYYRIEVLSGE